MSLRLIRLQTLHHVDVREAPQLDFVIKVQSFDCFVALSDTRTLRVCEAGSDECVTWAAPDGYGPGSK